ncbi:TPA: hypothetical protein ACJT8N_001153 [Legionella pneumophila]|nr:hypothetical protein [Legionella pneumophila]
MKDDIEETDMEETDCAICGIFDYISNMELKEFNDGKDPDGEDLISKDYVCHHCATVNPYGE